MGVGRDKIGLLIFMHVPGSLIVINGRKLRKDFI